MYNILPYNYLQSGAAGAVCNLFGGELCTWAMSMASDADPSIDNTDRYDVYTAQLPSGASYKNYLHYAQLIQASDDKPFVRYDYGSSDENKKHYGQKTAPAYDLPKVKIPLGIFYGSQDLLADDKDVPWLLDQMKDNTVFKHEYYLGHTSFMIAKDMSYFTVEALWILNMKNGKSYCDQKFKRLLVQ